MAAALAALFALGAGLLFAGRPAAARAAAPMEDGGPPSGVATGAEIERDASWHSDAGDVVVFLVRHAERAEDGTRDPSISTEGRARAEALAAMLRDAGLTAIHSTDFKRTRQTATPVADGAGLSVAIYDPRKLKEFAGRLRETPGRHLVVGHSNTTPDLVAALGGDPGAPIAEDGYDRLYILFISPEGAETVLLRFGTR
ncbi:MAG: histidine phosphatase family protein [Gemmatimonadota bacterium]